MIGFTPTICDAWLGVRMPVSTDTYPRLWYAAKRRKKCRVCSLSQANWGFLSLSVLLVPAFQARLLPTQL